MMLKIPGKCTPNGTAGVLFKGAALQTNHKPTTSLININWQQGQIEWGALGAVAPLILSYDEVIVNAWLLVYYWIYLYELSVESLKIVHEAERRVRYF